MAKTTPRAFQYQAPMYLRRNVNYNDTNISTGVFMGTIPNGAQVLDAVVNVRTAFNAGSTNTLAAGITSTAYSDIISTADATLATTGSYRAAILTAGDRMTTDSDVYIRYFQSGSSASTGLATVVITYALDNDGAIGT